MLQTIYRTTQMQWLLASVSLTLQTFLESTFCLPNEDYEIISSFFNLYFHLWLVILQALTLALPTSHVGLFPR